MDTKRWIIFSAIVVAVIAGMVYMSIGNRLDLSDISKEDAARILDAEERNGNIADHVRGNAEAKVVLVEYGDYQCPGCVTYSTTVNSLVEKYGENMAFVFRNFPLTTIHPNARAASAAAEAAGMQGKYWEMHDLLFANQTEWASTSPANRNDIFTVYARQIALDEATFLDDLSKEAITQKINFDVALGKLYKVTGTPTFFIDGEVVPISQDNPSALEDAIKEALTKAGVELGEEK